MSTTPSFRQPSKRKQPATAAASSRKRVRISDDVGRPKSLSSKLRDQRTLTQIQWINSPQTSIDDEYDLQEIGLDRGDSTRERKSKTGKARKRDSTLTQMDWLGKFSVHQDDTMDDIEMLPQQENNSAPSIPQVDGAHNSPRKSRNRKSIKLAKVHRSSSLTTPERETQDFLPGKRDKRAPGISTLGSNRRKSARIASKSLSDPKDNIQYMNRTLSGQKGSKIQHESKQYPPKLEIMDTLEPDDEWSVLQVQRLPETPRRQREIPSSQTPETIKQNDKGTKRRVEATPVRRSTRKPLQEKSANIVSKSYSRGLKESKSLINDARLSPKRSKICVLKVPQKELLKRPAFVDDSQRDVYSLQGTSSASEPIRNSDKVQPNEQVVSHTPHLQQPVEIPPTSQQDASSSSELPSSPPIIEADGSLPELSDLIPSRRLDLAPIPYHRSSTPPHNQAYGENSVMVRDFGRLASRSEMENATGEGHEQVHRQAGSDEMLLDDDSNTAKPTGTSLPAIKTMTTTHEPNEDDAFGSPTANDTQFNLALLERTSSPHIKSSNRTPQRQADRVRTATPTRSQRDEASACEVEVIGSNAETPLPIPRLIGRLTPLTHTQRDEPPTHSDEPKLPTSDASYETVTTIPLNDAVKPSSSSSPFLPPSKPIMQRSVHPASIPRPSQISTQEPTQNYFLSSLNNITQHPTQHDRITIKDSSDIRLSQIPQHESQSQGLNLRLIDESDEDVDELDLDPSSTMAGRQSARKPSALTRYQTGSSLRSIHPPSDLPRSRETQQVPSSPPLQPTVTPSTGNKQGTVRRFLPKAPRPAQDPTTTIQRDVVDDTDATSSSPISSPGPAPLKRKYDPLPGFDNDTQSNFTQDGHVTAAYVHRQRETGAWPEWFVPEPFRVEGASMRKRKRTR